MWLLADDATPRAATPSGIMVEAVRLVLMERHEPMTFDAWIAAIEHVVTFDVDTELWRKYFDAGLKPLEAIEQHRVDEEV